MASRGGGVNTSQRAWITPAHCNRRFARGIEPRMTTREIVTAYLGVWRQEQYDCFT
jgi:hypothetical protein